MIRFFLSRLLQAIPVIFIVITATFFLIRSAPGGPFDADKVVSQEVIERLNERYNLDAPLHEHIEMFHRAAVVIAPHGAGLSNLIFCREGTAVVEIGFDSSRGMQLDDMYFQLSLGLRLRYWLIIGRGSYVGRMTRTSTTCFASSTTLNRGHRSASDVGTKSSRSVML